MNSKSNPEQKEQCWRYHNTSLQIILQSHNKKNRTIRKTVLEQKQTQRPMEQKRRPEINPHSSASDL
jgi:hypothetical protein